MLCYLTGTLGIPFAAKAQQGNERLPLTAQLNVVQQELAAAAAQSAAPGVVIGRLLERRRELLTQLMPQDPSSAVASALPPDLVAPIGLLRWIPPDAGQAIHRVLDTPNVHRLEVGDECVRNRANFFWERFTAHFTSVYGSWPKVGGVEIDVFARQRLQRAEESLISLLRRSESGVRGSGA